MKTNRNSTTSFPLSLRWTVYVAPNPLKGGSKSSKAQSDRFSSKIWTKSAITSKRCEIGCQLVLITSRKSRTGFRLVPTSVTVNDLARCKNVALFHWIRRRCKPIRESGWKCQNWSTPAARSLCDSWATFINSLRLGSSNTKETLKTNKEHLTALRYNRIGIK